MPGGIGASGLDPMLGWEAAFSKYGYLKPVIMVHGLGAILRATSKPAEWLASDGGQAVEVRGCPIDFRRCQDTA